MLMKNSLTVILILLLFVQVSCKKDQTPKTSGTITIDNTLYGSGPYYAFGFSVPTGEKVSTANDQLDVITILADVDINNEIRRIFFDTRNFKESFFLFGEYSDATTALSAFNNLKSFSNPQWVATADTIKMNQIWLFRTSQNKYAKIRVVNTLMEKRNNIPYAECTLEWIYQPDGTLTFPGK